MSSRRLNLRAKARFVHFAPLLLPPCARQLVALLLAPWPLPTFLRYSLWLSSF